MKRGHSSPPSQAGRSPKRHKHMPTNSEDAEVVGAPAETTQSQEREEKEKLHRALDEAVQRRRLHELHTHLMGMGSADFWVLRIMTTYLPAVVADVEGKGADALGQIKELMSTQLHKGYRTVKKDSQLKSWEVFEKEVFDKKLFEKEDPSHMSKIRTFLSKQSDTMEQEFTKRFTADVVYSVKTLCKALDIKGNTEEMKLYFLQWRLHHSKQHHRMFRHYIIFNARHDQFQLVYGIRNTDLLKLMDDSPEGATITAMIRNCFSMLNRDGSEPKETDLSAFRGNFTPEFYPMRFELKDPIVEQYPEVLGILLNVVLNRYAKAGVQHIEFSLSAGMMRSAHIWKHLNGSVYSKPVETSQRKSLRRSSSALGAKSLSLPTQLDATTPSQASQTFVRRSSSQSTKSVASHDGDGDDDDDDDLRGISANRKPDNTVGKMEAQKPRWRAFLSGYTDKRDSVSIAFLMAFNRGFTGKQFKDTMIKHQFWTEDKAKSIHGDLPSLALLQAVVAESSVSERMLAWLYEEPNDAFIADMFAKQVVTAQALRDILTEADDRETSGGNMKLKQYLKAFVVGFDLVGDELGFPYAPFGHSVFQDLANQLPYASGFRLHGGEGLVRAPNVDDHISSSQEAGQLDKMFMYHLRHVMRCVEMLKGRDYKVRIGHGIALLRSFQEGNQRNTEMEKWRKYLRDKDIPCELNGTSNDTLLTDHYDDKERKRALALFLQAKIPVVLGTDDDGIWPIHKCQQHYFHVSVAHEFCQAIQAGLITTEKELEELIGNGAKYRFFKAT